MKISEYQLLVLLDVLKHACKFVEFDGMKGQELLKLYNEIMSQQNKDPKEIDPLQYSNDTQFNSCEHDWGNTTYTSNPPQHKCIKCGYMEFIK